MRITLEEILKFNPCKDRIDNFTRHYPNYSGSVREFLSLDNITYADKVWVCARLMSPNQRFTFAKTCALSVLSIYETAFPYDHAPRNLLAYLGTIEDVDDITRDQFQEINTRAYAATSASVYAATNASAYAASAGTQQELNLIFLCEIMETV